MKFATSAVMALLMAENVSAFAPFAPVTHNKNSYKSSSTLSMALDIDVDAVVAPPACGTSKTNVETNAEARCGGLTSNGRSSAFLFAEIEEHASHRLFYFLTRINSSRGIFQAQIAPVVSSAQLNIKYPVISILSVS